MIKIAHLGAYDGNIGDNIALLNARKGIEKYCDDTIEWKSIQLKDFHGHMNNTEYCVERFREISKNNDVLLVGGGGLVQQEMKYPGRCSLPLTEETLKEISIPIVCLSVGFNIFRRIIEPSGTGGAQGAAKEDVVRVENSQQISGAFIGNVMQLIKKSAFFSFRNDGSMGRMNALFQQYEHKFGKQNIGKIFITPDPGLISDFQVERKEKLTDGIIQPAWNRSADILNGRFRFCVINISLIGQLQERLNLKVFPHCIKDYDYTLGTQDPRMVGLNSDPNLVKREEHIPRYHRVFYDGTLDEEDYIMSQEEFKKDVVYDNFMDIMEKYKNYDHSVTMRGHGQMIPMAMNIPFITLSTQPKVYDFAQLHGFEDYTLDTIFDTQKDDWHLLDYEERIIQMVEDLRSNKENYLLKWYEQRDSFIKQCNSTFNNSTKLINEIIRGHNG